jgi:hypothetical protein
MQGEEASYPIAIPSLRVKRDWFVGLDPDFIDHSHPDVGGATQNHRRLQMDGDDGGEVVGAEQKEQITEEGADSFQELFGADDIDSEEQEGGEEEQEDGILNDGDVDIDPHLAGDDYHIDYRHWDHHTDLWEGDHDIPHNVSEYISPFIYVDPHVLATPAIADIDGDGREEMVVAVSYFFDRNEYDDEDHRSHLGKDVDIRKYVACGIVVYDLQYRTIKWTQHLDLSTDYTQYKAYVHSAPTLADINNDGMLEVIIGTSMVRSVTKCMSLILLYPRVPAFSYQLCRFTSYLLFYSHRVSYMCWMPLQDPLLKVGLYKWGIFKGKLLLPI